MPAVRGVLETALYTDDKPRSVGFFRDVMGLPVMLDSERLTALDAGGGATLLIFRRGASTEGDDTPGGHIPGHDGNGPLHMCFRIAGEDYEAWRTHLRAAGIEALSEVTWPAGSRSFYFEDPDGHVLELATPGLWPNDPERR